MLNVKGVSMRALNITLEPADFKQSRCCQALILGLRNIIHRNPKRNPAMWPYDCDTGEGLQELRKLQHISPYRCAHARVRIACNCCNSCNFYRFINNINGLRGYNHSYRAVTLAVRQAGRGFARLVSNKIMGGYSWIA